MSEIYKKFSTSKYEVHFKVDEECDGLRLDQFLSDFLVSFSRQQIKKKITDGDIKIQGRPHPHKASTKVYQNEIVELFTLRGTLEDEYWRGELIKLDLDPKIIYEDENIIAISKPAFMTTHPSGKHLFNCATVYFEEKFNQTMHSIHRIDRETSGTLLLAKNPKTANHCTSKFENDEVSKCYFLMAHRTDITEEDFTAYERLGSIEDFIPRLYVHCFRKDSKHGKHAQTTFKTVFKNMDYIFMLAFPKTGRQHQIRAHSAIHGFSLIGDKLYNGDPTIFMRFKDEIATDDDHDQMQLPRHALHALALKFPYPNDEMITLRSNLPEDFKDWIKENIDEISIDVLELKINTLLKDFF